MPVAGTVPVTVPVGLPWTPDTVSPSPCRVVVACGTVSSRTLGTVVVGGPVDTVTVTVDP